MGLSGDETDASVVEDGVERALSLKPAPAPLHHIQLLLNTRNRLAGYDLLSDVSAARRWLAALYEDDRVPGPKDCDDEALARLHELREALRELLSAHTTGRAPTPEALRSLRAAGATTRLSVDLDGSGRPMLLARNDSGGSDRVIDNVMAALASASPDQLQRLKACINPDCGWAFYDTSRSRSGTWCRMNVCGARHKMERYRSRRR
jgi:predicted RNA-binding Zn ribbon-like protein